MVGAIGFLTGRPFFALHRGSPKFMAHLGRMLPPPSDPAALARAVADINEELGMDVAVLGPGGEVIAAAGNPIPAPDPDALELARHGPLWVARGIIAAPTRGGGILVVRPPLPEGVAGREGSAARCLGLAGAPRPLGLYSGP